VNTVILCAGFARRIPLDFLIAKKSHLPDLGPSLVQCRTWREAISKAGIHSRVRFFFIGLLLIAAGARAQVWKPLGPPGGDVHSLAIDPSHPGKLFLGTADGHIFGSQDDGEHWTLLGRAGARQDAVITAIVVDPRDADVLFASARTQDPAAGGGIFRSSDGGRSWRTSGLEGQAVRALAIAPSDADILVAGTLDGVYRSDDNGKSWNRISPEHHEELRNLDSLVVDPRDPQTIYAGTFHLPWKTTDGGQTWRPIHDGMIDDSDVMSLFVDRATPGRVYAGACSGDLPQRRGRVAEDSGHSLRRAPNLHDHARSRPS